MISLDQVSLEFLPTCTCFGRGQGTRRVQSPACQASAANSDIAVVVLQAPCILLDSGLKAQAACCADKAGRL